MRNLVVASLYCAQPSLADQVSSVEAAAKMNFDRMPAVVSVDQIAGHCGATPVVNRQAAYCTSQNTIYIAQQVRAQSHAPYLVAHLFGHAVQVQHGVADVALREIRSRPAEEATLRGFVAGQVDCIAGFVMAQAGQGEFSIMDSFESEPFAGIHWGRDPLRIGPVVSIGIKERDEWLRKGQSGDISVCAPGEFGSELLVRALRN